MAAFSGTSLLLADNRRMLGKLLVVALLMFGFGYALVPMYRAICEALGVNVLSLAEQRRESAAGMVPMEREPVAPREAAASSMRCARE